MEQLRTVSAKEAAASAGVHVKTIRRWARKGRIVAFRLAAGGPLRIAIDPHGLTLPAPSASPASAEIEGALLDLAREDLLEDLAWMRSELEELRADVQASRSPRTRSNSRRLRVSRGSRAARQTPAT